MKSRTAFAALIVVVLAIVAVAAILILSVRGPTEVPPALQEGTITILESGDAVMELSTTVSMPQLAETYKEALENEGENSFKTAFHEGIQEEYKALTGIDVSVIDSEITTGPGGEFKISVNAVASQVGKYNSSEGLWEVDIRPIEENAVAADYILTQMMFAQMWLKSQPGEQQLELVSSIPIKLPGNADILNKDNLSASSWKIDFGSGMYREASLSVNEGQREVLLTERVVVTENAPMFNQITREIFSNYRAFTVKYDLPGGSQMGFANMSASGDERSGDSEDWSWTFRRSFSHTFSENFHGESDSATADLEVDATPSFGFTFFIGWDIDWAWDIPPWELDWFETYVEVDPAFRADMAADITGDFQYGWEEDITSWSHWVTVYVGPIPVEIEVRIELKAGVDASAAGDFHFDAGLDASTEFKLGVRYDGGWQNISDMETDFTYSGPNIEVGAEAAVTSSATMTIGAYIYGAAGPYVGLKPKVAGSLSYSPNTWSLDTGFEIIAGVGFGELGDWLPLSDIDVTLYDWMTPLATGTWRPNNARPTLTLENAPPSEGPAGDVYVFDVVYQDNDNDPPSYVRVYIDGKAENMTYENGDYKENGALYRYNWATTADDAGPHTYYFEAQDIQATARLPASGTYSGPTLWLRWADVSAGTGTSLGLTEGGHLWVWGYNESPIPLRMGEYTWREISAGWAYWNAIRLDRTLWQRTPSLFYQPDEYDGGPWNDWVAISAGGGHSLGIRSDGTLWSWGNYGRPELGQGENAIGTVAQVGTASDWVAVSAGSEYSLGVRSDGTLWAWGNNLYGQLGFDSGGSQYIWFPTQAGSGNNWVGISAGASHSLGLRSDGTLWAWGSNSGGMLGVGGDISVSRTPIQVGTDSDWTAISAGSWHSLALKSNGTLWAWGLNSWGELGIGVAGEANRRTTPVQVGENNNWVKIDAGDGYSLGVRSDGSLWAWGSNTYGQLGLGNTTDRTSPVQVGAVW